MGIEWVILNEEKKVILECSSSITDWSLSICAELEAILSAILVLQTGQNTNIFTDSQAAIDSIKYIKTSLAIKGHSGIKGNEEADRMAKNNTEKSTCIKIKDMQQKDLTYGGLCNRKNSTAQHQQQTTGRHTITILWNRNFFAHTTGINHDLPISFTHLMLRNFFPKGKYRKLKTIVKLKKIALTVATLFLKVFVNEFYNVIWQLRCKEVKKWEHTKGIKKQDIRKNTAAHQHIAYEQILILQIEDDVYDLERKKILKHNEQWSIALEKARKHINQIIIEGNRKVVKVYTEAI
ncbi:hypothetical protein GLOIN_2v1870151 [Rhizophagus clarus]|uniref:RNase H type-1 domain-containing protein n=2 Tax=Rhizophagus clarus TaxID=94130 RepID=A0A8H3QGP9_9GLOM|nr:hypothetical protein GLOIN_2v1870151 [Rhizophagus clarus]